MFAQLQIMVDVSLLPQLLLLVETFAKRLKSAHSQLHCACLLCTVGSQTLTSLNVSNLHSSLDAVVLHGTLFSESLVM